MYRRVSDDVEAGRTISQDAIRQAWEGVRELMHLEGPGAAVAEDTTSA
jgi:hypothetical protein